jgi:catechol 2,3-dioxygenase-like lactoylglutathione lyase family enzyme
MTKQSDHHMSTIKIDDIAYVRFTAPDLAEMRGFLEDFGLSVNEDAGRLFARGTSEAPFLHRTDPGEPGFAGLGLRAASLDDLKRLAEAEGVPVAVLDAPGGGYVVTLRDPDGQRVDVVTGQSEAVALGTSGESWNTTYAAPRIGRVKRTHKGASRVVRLGHCVLNVSDFRTSERWYKERFGFITSDEIVIPPELPIGAFLRCDRGERPTDHHTLFLVQAPKGSGFNHAAFEVVDMDDLMAGHVRLLAAGRDAAWGVGRHRLGSQVFDYWRDPWGHTLEHWTDGDRFTAASGSNVASLRDLLDVQWGPPAPITML